MKYSNESVRRQDHLLDGKIALDIIQNGEYGVLSMQRVEGGGYGVPLIYVWDGDSTIYIHGATEGRKLDCLHSNNIVSFCITGNHQVHPHHFTMAYQSIILDCRAFFDVTSDQKMKIFDMILDKYCAQFKEEGLEYARQKFNDVVAVRLEIVNITGKDEEVKEK